MITKAIIPVAGWGTRWLPITKSIEKCMLPIGNRPVVDYVVQDCIEAGITDIYFVVAEHSTQLRQYYENNVRLNSYLENDNKKELLKSVALPDGVKFHFVVQSQVKYGTAVPVSFAANSIEPGESAIVLMGDDFVYNPNGKNPIIQLIEETEDGGNSLLGVNIPAEEVSRYGVIDMSENNNFIQIVEKPSIEDAPSSLINISKYVLNKDVIDQIVQFVNTEKNGEYYITDVINEYVANGGTVKVVEATGEYLDGGNPRSWLHANRVVMGDIA